MRRYWIAMGVTVIAATAVSPWGDLAVIGVVFAGLALAHVWASRA